MRNTESQNNHRGKKNDVLFRFVKWSLRCGKQRDHAGVYLGVRNPDPGGAWISKDIPRGPGEHVVKGGHRPLKIEGPFDPPQPLECRDDLNGGESKREKSCQREAQEKSRIEITSAGPY